MNLEFSDEETAALLAELDRIIDVESVSSLAPHSHAEGRRRENQA